MRIIYKTCILSAMLMFLGGCTLYNEPLGRTVPVDGISHSVPVNKTEVNNKITPGCHETVNTSPESPPHSHKWCQGDGYTTDFCAKDGKCHGHKVDEANNQAVPVVQGSHFHLLAPSYMDLSAVQSKRLIDENVSVAIIDLSANFSNGHIAKAVNSYINNGNFNKNVSKLDKKGRFLVYCDTEPCSQLGAQKLIDDGIVNVYRLAGGNQAWTDAGFTLIK